MPTLKVFDPALCCSTGVCGPDVDPRLAQFSADLEWLEGQGVEVERYNLAQEPQAFAANAVVRGTLQSSGTECLPLVMVDGVVVSQTTYPGKDALAGFVRLGATDRPAASACSTPTVTQLGGRANGQCC